MADIQQADLFEVPLLDGTSGLGQVIEAAPGALFILISGRRRGDTGAVPVALDDVLGLFTVAPAPLVQGQWPTFGFDMIPKTRQLRHHDQDWQDAVPTDPALIEAFLNACHGLFDWDGFPDPDIFTKMLAPGRTRPAAATFSSGARDDG